MTTSCGRDYYAAFSGKLVQEGRARREGRNDGGRPLERFHEFGKVSHRKIRPAQVIGPLGEPLTLPEECRGFADAVAGGLL